MFKTDLDWSKWVKICTFPSQFEMSKLQTDLCTFGIPLGSKKTHFENAKPNFVLKKKKAWFAKNFVLKNHVCGMQLKALFSTSDFDKNMVRKWITKQTLL
jgi:hypothetical protein